MGVSHSGRRCLAKVIAAFLIVLTASAQSQAQMLLSSNNSRVGRSSRSLLMPPVPTTSEWRSKGVRPWGSDLGPSIEYAGSVVPLTGQSFGQVRTRANRAAQKITAGVALGVAGFFAGGLVGGALDNNCRCDDPHLRGIVIGASIGAVVGAIMGVSILR